MSASTSQKLGVNNPSTDSGPDESLPHKLLDIENKLSNEIKKLLPKLRTKYVVYCPLEYAAELHAKYVNKYCKSKKKILFLGENPGFHGMCQTGISFGEVNTVKDWLKLEGDVGKPDEEHPKKLIKGLHHHRREESGKRFYGYFKESCKSSDDFFKHAFVYNYCPITLLERSEERPKYVNLRKLKKSENQALFALCTHTLIEVIMLLEIEVIIGLGEFAHKKAIDIEKACKASNKNILVLRMDHPSPLSRAVQKKKWMENLKELLNRNDLEKYFDSDNAEVKNES